MQQLAIDALRDFWNCRAERLSVVGEADRRRCFRVESSLGPLFVKVQEAPEGVEKGILSGLQIQRYLQKCGVRASEILEGVNGLGYAEVNGFCVTAERWAEQEDLRLSPLVWEELGSLCGRLHAVPVPSRLTRFVSRLDPRRSLEAVMAYIAEHRGRLPRDLMEKALKYESQARALSCLWTLPRTIVHSDITWGNVIRNRGELILIDLEGAGVAPAVMDLVEVTTKLCGGPSASGPLNEEGAQAFYRGYRVHRTLTPKEVGSFPEAHLFHQLYFLADAIRRDDFDYTNRMDARLANWQNSVYGKLADAATPQ